MKETVIRLLALAVVVAVAASCATTTITGAWKEESFQGPPIPSALVIGLVPNPSTRKIFEDEFVRQLAARGVAATVSHDTIPYDRVSDRTILEAYIKSVADDSVIVVRYVKRETVAKYIPGTVSTLPNDYYSDLPTYVLATAGIVETPSEVFTDDLTYVETNVYNARTGKILWSAQSETWMIEKMEDLIRAFSKTIIEKLASDRIIR